MSTNPDSDRVLDAFAAELASVAAEDGWKLVRLVIGNSDRSCEARSDRGSVAFEAHLSQTKNGFWGLTPSGGDELLRSGRSHLVLLRTASSGYFISNPVLQHLMPQFSVHKETRAIKINEGIIKSQPRFRAVEDLWQMLNRLLK
jgi:hypothetical protein